MSKNLDYIRDMSFIPVIKNKSNRNSTKKLKNIKQKIHRQI